MVKEKQNRRNYFEQGWRVRMSASTTRKGLLKRLALTYRLALQYRKLTLRVTRR